MELQGLGSPTAVRALKEVIKASNPPVVGLFESKSDCNCCELIRVKLGFDCCFAVPACGRSGGLVLLWNNSTDVSVVSYSDFHIDFILKYKVYVHITLFYGHPRTSLRYKSWRLLRKLRELIRLPWCVIGDFNEICNFSETTSRNLSRCVNMELFRNVLLDCGLMDLGYKGSKFTFSNRRQGLAEVECRLDRAVGDDLWIDLFPNACIEHLVSHHSDHCPLLLKLDGNNEDHDKRFRFESMWTRDASLADTVNSAWNSNADFAPMADKLADLSHQ
ncbi:hypothetical protein QQ045_007226 [Rhodiola kirilowii]